MNKGFDKFMPNMDSENIKIVTNVSMGIGIVIYILLIAFLGQKNYHLVSWGLPSNAQGWAWIGVIGVGASSLVLPLVMHFWAHEKWHSFTVRAAYVADLIILFLTAYTDWHFTIFQNTGTVMPDFAAAYMSNFAPLTPAFVVVIWALIFFADPHMKNIHKLKSTKEAIIRNVFENAKSYTESVEFNAYQDAITPAVVIQMLKQLDLPVAGPAAPNLPVARHTALEDLASSLEAVPQEPVAAPVAEVPVNNGSGPVPKNL